MLSIRLNALDFSRKTHIQLASHSPRAVHKPTDEEGKSNIKQKFKCSTSEKEPQAMPREKYDYNQGMIEVKRSRVSRIWIRDHSSSSFLNRCHLLSRVSSFPSMIVYDRCTQVVARLLASQPDRNPNPCERCKRDNPGLCLVSSSCIGSFTGKRTGHALHLGVRPHHPRPLQSRPGLVLAEQDQRLRNRRFPSLYPLAVQR